MHDEPMLLDRNRQAQWWLLNLAAPTAAPAHRGQIDRHHGRWSQIRGEQQHRDQQSDNVQERDQIQLVST
jgi:hypothetical protein